jgi:hypothetical protein
MEERAEDDVSGVETEMAQEGVEERGDLFDERLKKDDSSGGAPSLFSTGLDVQIPTHSLFGVGIMLTSRWARSTIAVMPTRP